MARGPAQAAGPQEQAQRHSASKRRAHTHIHLELWVGLGQLRVQHAEGAALLGGLRPQLSPQPGRIDGLLLLQPVFACAEVAAIQGCDPGQGVIKALDRMVLERGQPSISCQVHSAAATPPSPHEEHSGNTPHLQRLVKTWLVLEEPGSKSVLEWLPQRRGARPLVCHGHIDECLR